MVRRRGPRLTAAQKTELWRLCHTLGLIRSRGHVPKGGYDVPNGSNHTSAVTPAIQ